MVCIIYACLQPITKKASTTGGPSRLSSAPTRDEEEDEVELVDVPTTRDDFYRLWTVRSVHCCVCCVVHGVA
jgi:hypothetical protein